MILIKQVSKFFITISLVLFISIFTAFGFKVSNSFALTKSILVMNPPSNQIAWNWSKRSEALAKDIEGKTQETMGNITGDPKDQFMGNAKQVKSDIITKTEDIKDSMSLKGRPKAVIKNIEGKAQSAIGDLTGDSKDKLMGNVKQKESQVRNAIEDIKGN